MRRWAITAALLLAMGAAGPARAGDVDDCLVDFSHLPDLSPTDRDRMVTTCRRLADLGNAHAQTNLGTMYYVGWGVPSNDAEAARWYRKAADQGDVSAQINLGWLYAWGDGVPQNYAEAAKWYRKAADQGDGMAQNNLGLLYLDGHGVLQDYVQAYLWFNLAAAQWHRMAATPPSSDPLVVRLDAPKNRDRVAAKMTPEQIDKAQALAAAWKPTTGQ